jgi:hypothetical protein
VFREDEYFGDPARIGALEQAAALWSLVRANSRYSYYGRTVGLSGPSSETANELAALARLQGAGTCYYCPKETADELSAQLAGMGLDFDRHEQYRGGAEAYAAARGVLAGWRLPDDIKVIELSSESEAGLVAEVAAMSAAEGVMPAPGSVMRGVSIPGVVFVAIDRMGKPVGSASSRRMFHRDHARGTDVFWGALTTRPERRGQKIGLILGAMAIIRMWETHGARGFITGVRQDNVSSQRLCMKLGVCDTEWVLAHCIDTNVLGSNRYTK